MGCWRVLGIAAESEGRGVGGLSADTVCVCVGGLSEQRLVQGYGAL